MQRVDNATSLGPFSGQLGHAQKCLPVPYKQQTKRLNCYLKTVNLFKIGWAVIEKSWHEYDPKLTCLCDLLPTEVAWDVISGRNTRAMWLCGGKFWRCTSSTFRDFPKRKLCHGEVGDGSGGMNAICIRSEVADDVISGIDVDTFRCYACVNLWVASFSSFLENLNQPFMYGVDDGWSSWAPFSGSRSTNV